jgi:uncharacterized protein (DUF2252 family)
LFDVFQKSIATRGSRVGIEASANLKMARSAHAYVRGSTVKFYEWLEDQKRGSLPEAPPVWICGDCHAGNLGPVAALDGRIANQIRDLDQTVIGNPAHDINELERQRSKTLDAPSWLWSSVVSLIGNHETAYLEHCRKYATEVPAAK